LETASHDLLQDPRVPGLMTLLAIETGVPADAMRLEARTDELGIGSLDLTLALFELEDVYKIDLPPLPEKAGAATLGELLAHVLAALDAKAGLPLAGLAPRLS
jgi:acyl carrier protein